MNNSRHPNSFLLTYFKGKELQGQERQEDIKVTTYVINKGQKNQYFGLKNAKSGDVLHYAPNNWKTEKGALNWAKKNGYEIA